jgi:hypothetical protein
MSFHARVRTRMAETDEVRSARRSVLLGASEPVNEFDRRPFEHPLLSSMDSAAQVGSANPGTR